MQQVPTKPLPSQVLQIQLAGQSVTLNIYQTPYGLFMDVIVGSTIIIAGVICQDLNKIVRSAYLGFIGDFAWNDTQGSANPIYTGLGSRWQLIYLEAADLPAGNGS